MNAAIDITGIVLHTERLLLRPWQAEDLMDLYAYASVPGVGEMAGWEAHKNTAESEKILQSFIAGKKTFALVREGRCIGSLGIEEYDEKVSPELARLPGRELGFVLAKPYWGQGLMKEAVEEVLRWLFTEKQLAFVTCGYFLWNKQSQRLQEKCGFRPYRTFSYLTHCGTREETQLCLLWKEDWQKQSCLTQNPKEQV